MRAPFDTDCDIYRGPTFGIPQALIVAGVPCRLVPEFYDPPTSEPFADRVAYMTLEAHEPHPADGSVLWPIITLDMETADQVAIPSGASINYRVVWVEIINFSTFPQYFRAHLATVP